MLNAATRYLDWAFNTPNKLDAWHFGDLRVFTVTGDRELMTGRATRPGLTPESHSDSDGYAFEVRGAGVCSATSARVPVATRSPPPGSSRAPST